VPHDFALHPEPARLLTGRRALVTGAAHYLGRAVAALAADPDVHAKTGGVYRVADLAREYGFTDIDGKQPLPML